MNTDSPILICYDGSEEAAHAIDVAAELLSQRHAVVLDVGPPLGVGKGTAASPSPLVGPEFQEENLAAANRRAAEGADRARQAGFEAEARAEIDAPTWQGIVDEATALGAAVIVVGSHGRKGVTELIEGSVSHQVAVHSDRPVLIVPHPAP